MKDLFVNVLTPDPLLDPELGLRLFAELEQRAPGLTPERVGNWEPLQSAYSTAAVRSHWLDPFLWSRTRPATSGTVWMGYAANEQHSSINLSTEAARAPTDDLLELMLSWATLVCADLALVHHVAPGEVERGFASGALSALDIKTRKRFDLFLTTHMLRRGLPDLYWATLFGPAYVAHFGRERLLSAPAPIVREVGSEHVLIQLSPSPLDFARAHGEVSCVRDAVRVHLGERSFAGADEQGNAPAFAFPVPGRLH